MVLQMNAAECGAACLGMILAHHKRYVPLEKLRIDCGVSRDGSNAKNIAMAAEQYGLQPRAFSLEIDEINKVRLPAIIHWNFNHFVVLSGISDKYMIINDPAYGLNKVSHEEFQRSFTGVALTFQETASFLPGGVKPSGLNFFKKLSANQMPVFLMLLLLSGVVALLSAMPSFYARIFIDYILILQNVHWLTPLLIAMLITLIISFIGITARKYLLTNIKIRLGIIANTSYIWHILKLPVDFFSTRFASDLSSRQFDYDEILTVFCEKLVPLALSGVMLFIYIFLMLKIDTTMAVTGTLVIILNFFILFYISKRRFNSMRVQNRDESGLISATASTIELIETVKVSGGERNAFAKWANYYSKKNNAQIAYINMASKLEQVPGFLNDILSSIILMVGIHAILHNDITIGTFIAFQGLLLLTINPISQIADSASKIQETYGKIERIEDVLNYIPDSSYSIKPDLGKNEGLDEFELVNVTFGYSPVSKPVVKNISFKVKKGEIVAIVGQSGSGKSTIYKLIAGLYKAWEGDILFQGRPISQISREELTNFLSVANESGAWFTGTVFENITLWDYSIDSRDVFRAARDVGIHETITRRAGGYEGLVTEGGKNFSGGQKQCLEMARALCQNPSILILDEATSGLDTIREKKIMETIKDRGITCLVISHRLSMVRDCDLILVLDDGEIVERGTHDELLSQKGKYERLILAEAGCDRGE